jgi:cell wall-associated NlpC family hydrolase
MPRSLLAFPRRARACVSPIARLATLLVLPALPIGAQSSTVSPVRFETFAARNESTASTLFGGLSLSGHSGLLGFRVGGSLAGFDLIGDNTRITSTPTRVCTRGGCRTVMRQRYGSASPFSVDAWTADADLLVEPFRSTPVFRQLLLGFSPYAFAGIGRYNGNGASALARDTSLGVWSYGAGVHHELIGRLGLTGEARVRRTLEDNAFVGGTFRNAIQYRLGLSVGLGGGASQKSAPTPIRIIDRRTPRATSPAPAPLPVPAPAAPVVVDERAAAAVVATLLDEADALVETRWTNGGTLPADGFDAGGFVQYVFAQQDIAIPRLVSELATTGVSVASRVGSLRPGDLLLFSNDGTTPDHVAIYVGRDRFIHATASAGAVRYDVLGEGERGAWFAEHLVGVRRVLGTRATSVRQATPALAPSGRADGAPRPSGAP